MSVASCSCASCAAPALCCAALATQQAATWRRHPAACAARARSAASKPAPCLLRPGFARTGLSLRQTLCALAGCQWMHQVSTAASRATEPAAHLAWELAGVRKALQRRPCLAHCRQAGHAVHAGLHRRAHHCRHALRAGPPLQQPRPGCSLQQAKAALRSADVSLGTAWKLQAWCRAILHGEQGSRLAACGCRPLAAALVSA